MPPVKKERARRIVGWREWVELPEIAARPFRAKLDTGALTSALHVESLEIEHAGARQVAVVTLDRALQGRQPPLRLPVVDRRVITPSSGEGEHRYVTKMRLKIDGMTWPIEVTLTDRSDMRYPMLIGRAALAGRLIVDPQLSYASGHPTRDQTARKAKKKPPKSASARKTQTQKILSTRTPTTKTNANKSRKRGSQ